jgi:putative hydrolases of HD superfamily
MATQDFQAIIDFAYELEKLKGVARKIKPLGLPRYENSAEHSWQIALVALSLLAELNNPVEPLKVVTMLLIHDLVEIDTGDKFAYSADHDDFENEHAAAKRIFALLPGAIADKYLAIWEEFEAAQSPEAKFAKGVDRMMPVLQNLQNGCQSWLEHDISVSQVLAKNQVVAEISPELWELVKTQVRNKAKQMGVRD